MKFMTVKQIISKYIKSTKALWDILFFLVDTYQSFSKKIKLFNNFFYKTCISISETSTAEKNEKKSRKVEKFKEFSGKIRINCKTLKDYFSAIVVTYR